MQHNICCCYCRLPPQQTVGLFRVAGLGRSLVSVAVRIWKCFLQLLNAVSQRSLLLHYAAQIEQQDRALLPCSMVTGQTKAVLTIPERGLEKGQRLPAAACGIEHESSAAGGGRAVAAAAVMDLPIVILSDDGNSMTAGMKAASNDMKGAGKKHRHPE